MTAGAEELLSALATVACADEVDAYVVLWHDRFGEFSFSRYGPNATCIGMLEIMKRGLINGMSEVNKEDKEYGEDDTEECG